VNVAALISGSGAFARVAHANRDRLGAARLALVVCDRPNAALDFFARETDVPTVLVDYDDHPGRDAAEREIARACEAHAVDRLFLTYRRLVGPVLLERFPGRIYNLHLGLLPAFPGLEAVRAAHRSGALFAGATVHQVDAGADTGPIASQVVVPRGPAETEAELTHRVFRHAAALYVDALRKVGAGPPEPAGGGLRLRGARYGALPFNPALDVPLEDLRFPQPPPAE